MSGICGTSSCFANALRRMVRAMPLLLRRLERDDGLFPGLQVFQSGDTVGISGLQDSPFVAAAPQFCIANSLDTSRTQSTNVWTTGFIVRPFKVTIATGQERIGRSTGNKITEDAALL